MQKLYRRHTKALSIACFALLARPRLFVLHSTFDHHGPSLAALLQPFLGLWLNLRGEVCGAKHEQFPGVVISM
jgi:hypothetical protein